MVLEAIQDAVHYIQTDPSRFVEALRLHLMLSATALALAFIVAFPLGIWASKYQDFGRWLTGVFNAFRVIPSLAILAFMIPILGTGMKPALIALVLLAIPPILINTIQGVVQIKPDVHEAALGMGMGSVDIFRRVTLPLAWPSILSGTHTASVEVLASATLSALIGGGGLGVFIINGLGMYNMSLLLVGAVPIIALVLVAEFLFRFSESAATRYQAC